MNNYRVSKTTGSRYDITGFTSDLSPIGKPSRQKGKIICLPSASGKGLRLPFITSINCAHSCVSGISFLSSFVPVHAMKFAI